MNNRSTIENVFSGHFKKAAFEKRTVYQQIEQEGPALHNNLQKLILHSIDINLGLFMKICININATSVSTNNNKDLI